MARITLGSLISNIAGSIGGITFSRNASGLIAKSKIRPKASTTASQKIAIQKDMQLIALWNELPFLDKMDWKDYASTYTKTDRYGRVKHISGYNWFVSINNAQRYMGLPYLTTPPTFAYPAYLPSLEITLGTGEIICTWSTPIDSSLVDLYIFSSPPIKGTARYNNGAYRQQQKLSTDFSTSFNILEGWEKAHKLDLNSLLSLGSFQINVQIFAINKANGITGQSVTAIGNS